MRYAASRALAAIPALLGVVVVSFLFLHLMPGDPVDVLVSRLSGPASPETIAAAREAYGLDKSLPMQLVTFVGNALQGDLGESPLRGRSVGLLIKDALPYTVELAFFAAAISVLVGVPIGVLAAVRRGRFADRVAIFLSLLSISTPEFWLAIVAILIFAVNLGWVPAIGVGGIEHLILPGLILGVRSAASFARLTRSAMLEVLNNQYIMTARARGTPELIVIGVYALRNALIPIVTLIGLEVGRFLGGAIVVETIFARPGIGGLLANAILDKDIAVVRGTILVIGVALIVINILVDLIYGVIDPRVRVGRR